MTFGLAWGVNNGVLDKDEYGPVVVKAWNGMVKLAVQVLIMVIMGGHGDHGWPWRIMGGHGGSCHPLFSRAIYSRASPILLEPDHSPCAPFFVCSVSNAVPQTRQASGRLGYCQPIGGGPNPSNSSLTSDFCVGLFMLAGEQVAKMAN
jgi:hypothetical protein